MPSERRLAGAVAEAHALEADLAAAHGERLRAGRVAHRRGSMSSTLKRVCAAASPSCRLALSPARLFIGW